MTAGADEDPEERLDVVIVGAGLSGIGMAHHLRAAFPWRSYAILETRGSVGGTWDLFRYPGARSDSDMSTLGYRFKPWTREESIADAAAVRDYIRETAEETGIAGHIRFHHRLMRADWDSARSRWRLLVRRSDTDTEQALACDVLLCCSGYYRYESGYTPDFPGQEDYRGSLVHPQHWPEDLDHTGKRMVVIGSGATAVSLVPALARDAAHVTMLQRSPSYIVSQPTRDPLAALLRRCLPDRWTAAMVRGLALARQVGFYEFCRRRPHQARALLRRWVARQLPADVDVDTHFRPAYDPWDQRLCVVPGGDLFRALREHRVEMVTDHVERLTRHGVLLRSGRHLDADVVVTATGLTLQAFGGIELSVDGVPVRTPQTMAYKGMMLGDVPNFAFVVGYTNASWTLKLELVCDYLVRVLQHLDREGLRVFVPHRDPTVEAEPLLDLRSGYVLRSLDLLPRQGTVAPWRLRMNYFVDRRQLRRGSLQDGVLCFYRDGGEARRPSSRAASGLSRG